MNSVVCNQRTLSGGRQYIENGYQPQWTQSRTRICPDVKSYSVLFFPESCLILFRIWVGADDLGGTVNGEGMSRFDTIDLMQKRYVKYYLIKTN